MPPVPNSKKEKLELNSTCFSLKSFQSWREKTSGVLDTNKGNIYNKEFRPHGLVTTPKLV